MTEKQTSDEALEVDQTLDLRKFALHMAMAPVLSSEDPTDIDFDSIVEAAMTYEHYLITGKLTEATETNEVTDNLTLVE